MIPQKSKNKLLYILPKSYYFSQGRRGRVTHALGVLQGLAKNNMNVTTLTGKGAEKYNIPKSKHISFVEIPPIYSGSSKLLQKIDNFFWNIKLIKYLKRLLKTGDIKNIIIRYGVSNSFIFLPFIKYFSQKTWIYEVNSLAYHQLNNFPNFIRKIILYTETFILNQADFIYVVSNKLKSDITQFIKNKNKILVVPNASRKKQFAPIHVSQKTSNNKINFIYFGKLHKYYNFKALIKTFNKINSKYKNSRLHFYGDGLNEAKVKLLASANKKILFHGRYNLEKINFNKIFKNAILVVPYIGKETIESPIKLFEYMNFGLPIIASKVGQIKNILKHKETALLYDPNNLESLEKCFIQIINNPELRKKIAKNAKKEFLSKHTWQKRMKDFYQKIKMHNEK